MRISLRMSAVCLFALLCVSALTAPVAASSLSIAVTTAVTDPGDALLVSAAALYFGVDAGISLQLRANVGSPTATISLFYLAGESQTEPETIYLERKKGRGWGALAKGKMPPGLVGKWKSGDPFSHSDQDFETGVSLRFLATYYSIAEDTLVMWARRGASVSDIALCLNLSARVKATPATIIDLRLKGQSWQQLATRYGVTMESLKQPVPPKAKYNKTIPGKSNKNAAASDKKNGKGK